MTTAYGSRSTVFPAFSGCSYSYGWENSGRVEFARNLDDETLDRWYAYDHVGRLTATRTGNEARLAIGEQVPLLYNGPYSHGYTYDQFGNITSREGWGGDNPSFTASYSNNRRVGLSYDAAGNLINDGGQNFTYDATGQAATASYSGYLLQQHYDGDRLRVKKVDGEVPTYYLRSSVLGGQVVAEINGSGTMSRGYVYLGGEALAVQQQGSVYWIHQDPLVKSKRVTNSSGNVVSTVELDPWGGHTNRSSNDAFQPHKFTTYERDGNASDEAMHRRYNRWWSRFDQPDPYDGSYDMTDPQSFNRYAYVQNDPVNFVDPSGLDDDYVIPAWENGWNRFLNPTETFINSSMSEFVDTHNWFIEEEDWGVGFDGFGPFSFGQRPVQTQAPIWERHSTDAEREQFRKQNEACKQAANDWLKKAQARLDGEPEKGPLQRAFWPFSLAGAGGSVLHSLRSRSGVVVQGLRITNAGLNGVRGGILVTGVVKGGYRFVGSIANFTRYAAKIAACDAMNSPTDFKDRVTR